MNTQFLPGNNVYFIANAIFAEEAQIVKYAAGNCIRFTDRSSGTLLLNRLYRTAEEAKADIRIAEKTVRWDSSSWGNILIQYIIVI